jgi:hypothetical protein
MSGIGHEVPEVGAPSNIERRPGRDLTSYVGARTGARIRRTESCAVSDAGQAVKYH